MKISNFDYPLPEHLIADSPAFPRDSSRLLVLDREDNKIRHIHFYDLPNILTENDVLVLNDTKVFPARLITNKKSGARIELLLLEKKNDDHWTAIHHGKIKIGDFLTINGLEIEVLNKKGDLIDIKFNIRGEKLFNKINEFGSTPLPPYIKNNSKKNYKELYQTIYAKNFGSVAAPTAGLHFTDKLIKTLKSNGIKIEFVTLHIGLDTFAPVREDNLSDHQIHSEKYIIDEVTAKKLNSYKNKGRRIIAVGTTTTRVLESALGQDGHLMPQSSSTELFIYPPYRFSFVNAIITNFHLPKSTLLAMISAFVSYPNTKDKFKNFLTSSAGKAYMSALEKKYRFYSFGDAMLIT